MFNRSILLATLILRFSAVLSIGSSIFLSVVSVATVASVVSIVSIVSTVSVASVASAHEGHDHAPGSFVALHGGTVKPGKILNLEYITVGDTVKIYPTSHDSKDLTVNEVKLTGTATLPKSKPEVLNLTYSEGSYFTKLDFKNSYRVELKLKANFNGKSESFTLQIEK